MDIRRIVPAEDQGITLRAGHYGKAGYIGRRGGILVKHGIGRQGMAILISSSGPKMVISIRQAQGTGNIGGYVAIALIILRIKFESLIIRNERLKILPHQAVGRVGIGDTGNRLQ